MGTVFVDLDRTLLRQASGPVLHSALEAEGVVRSGRTVPGDRLLYALYDRFGENLFAMALARSAALMARGWSQEGVRRAGRRAVGELAALVAPFAPGILASLRDEGYRIVLSSTTPKDMIAPFAEAWGFDDVIATVYEVAGGSYTGRLEGGFVWGVGKLIAVRRWAKEHGEDLAACHACSDSFFDVPLLSSVGMPHAVNPDPSLEAVAVLRRWPIEHWDRPPGVPSIAGLEPYHLLRPFVGPQAFPYARFDIAGIEHVPRQGPAILAANHRSYFDVAALAVVAARIGRPVRFLAKKELFDVPGLGWAARSLGGIPVDRGGRSDLSLRQAEAALRAGEVVIVLPEGTIPRGEAFFDPLLQGKTGTVRLASATGAPVVPVGLWGTERVWPRSARSPRVTELRHPPLVQVRVGRAVPLGGNDAVADTRTVMDAISSLLPEEARVHRVPSAEELARTYPRRQSAGRASQE
ncbi:MAG: HAD-IB family hydrolase [Actinomycetota bacterium]|nr:HAD-IB family hydrolase [Actinomycetota bacterium]